MSEKKFRLVTRSDLDGLVSAVLLKRLNLIDEIKYVHPKDMQDGTVELSANDITTNLPYSPKVHLAFDHHQSEMSRLGANRPANYIIDPTAPSAAHVVYHHFGGKDKFADIPDDMIEGVDKADSAQFETSEVLEPSGWTLLSFITDPRTGLGRFRNFTISNYNLMLELVDLLCSKQTINDILKNPNVIERLDVYREHAPKAKEQIIRCTTVHNNLVVFDPRHEENQWATNRFMIYALYPQSNISIHVMWGLKQQNTVLAVGKSIFNRTSKINIGDLMLKYNGGGHPAAGTCQIENDKYQVVLDELVKAIVE